MVDPKDKASGPAGPDAQTTPSSVGSTEIERDARAGADTAKQAASDAAADAKQRARSFVEDKKDEAAGRVDGVAEALRSAAGSLDDQDQPAVAGYARQAASGLERVSDAISNRSVDDLMETVEDFARRQPIAFLGGAVLTGFVLSRFAKSTSEQRHSDRHGRYAASGGSAGRQNDGYNPVGMAPDDRTSHRFPDANKLENG